MVPRWAKAISSLRANSSINSIDEVTSDVSGLALDPVRLNALKARLADLAAPKDERKINSIAANKKIIKNCKTTTPGLVKPGPLIGELIGKLLIFATFNFLYLNKIIIGRDRL